MNAVIAQADVVTSYGWGVDALWDGLLSGKTSIRSSDRFNERGFISDQMALVPGLQIQPGESRAMAMLGRLLAPLVGKLDAQTPLILATTVGEIESIERSVLEDAPALAAEASPVILLGRIKSMLGLRGSAMVASSACASSTLALTIAAAMIRRGEAKAALVVACDAVSEFVYSGFSTLASLDSTPAKPFDAKRCGLSLGEGAAWAMVTADDSPLANAESTAILGWASTSDATHMTAPDRNAAGLSRAIAGARAMAGASNIAPAFIAAHGTATVYSDAMELTAFHAISRDMVPTFSIKGGIGHTLSAAGLIQIVIAGRALARQIVPPTIGCETPDANAAGWVGDKAVKLSNASIALSSNSGFGGVNTAIVLGTQTKALATISKVAGIQAIAWIDANVCGAIKGVSERWKTRAPDIDSADEMTQIVGGAMKYFGRMTPAMRLSVAAAGIAMKSAGWKDKSAGFTGIVAANYESCLSACVDYFRDYVSAGRSLGRGNLFIYTLPTSELGEVSIALSLTGPTAHLHADRNPVEAMILRARRWVEDGEADRVLALWADAKAAVCFAIGADAAEADLSSLDWTLAPSAMSQSLAAMVPEP